MNQSEWNKLVENQSTVMHAEAVIAAQRQFNVSTLEKAMGLTLKNCAILQELCVQLTATNTGRNFNILQNFKKEIHSIRTKPI